MKKIILLLVLSISVQTLVAQDLESLEGKDFRQPGKLNPALAGLQEDLFRLITDADLGNNLQIGFEGKLPLALGNYMFSYEQVYNENVKNNMYSFTYGRTSKTEKKYSLRYGLSLEIHQRNLFRTDFDSTKGYSFVDLNGELRTVSSLQDLNTSLDFLNLQFGFSFNYESFIASVGFDNVIKQNVSFVDSVSRNLPLAGNIFIGGFLKWGENVIVFPSLIGSVFANQIYAEPSIDVNIKSFNFGTSFKQFEDYQAITGNLAYHFKKLFLGLEYTHPLQGGLGLDQYPRFNLFFNAGLFKKRDLGKSEFAKAIRSFY